MPPSVSHARPAARVRSSIAVVVAVAAALMPLTATASSPSDVPAEPVSATPAPTAGKPTAAETAPAVVQRRARTAWRLAPSSALAGERLRVTGRLPVRRAQRVVLQRRDGRAWRTVARARSSSTGVVRMRTRAPARSTAVRVVAPGRRTLGSPSLTVTVVKPTSSALRGRAVGVSTRPWRGVARFAPARPGRPTVLEARVGDGAWAVVGRSQQAADGRVRLVGTALPAGEVSLRARTLRWRGARTSATAERLVTVSEAAPTTPSNLRAAPAVGAVSLAWDEVADADLAGYRLQRGDAADGPWTRLPDLVTAAAYDDGDAPQGAPSWYRVASESETGILSAWSEPASAAPGEPGTGEIDGQAPAAPTGLAATADTTSATLTWSANPEADLAGYRVYAAESEVGPWTLVAEPTAATAVIEDVAPGTTWFAVTAYDASGNESDRSTAISVTPTPSPSGPPAPLGLSVSPGDGQLVASWTAGANSVRGYDVWIAPSTDGPWSRATEEVAAPSATLTGLQNGTAYAVAVTALDAAGRRSPLSEPVVATPAADAGRPETPTGLLATPGNAQVTLSWSRGGDGDVASYTVFTGPGSNGPWTTVGTTTSTSRLITGLANGTAVWFTVSATSPGGLASDRAAAVVATPAAAETPPGAPTGVTAIAGDGRVGVTWDPSPTTNLRGYRVWTSPTGAGGWTTASALVSETAYSVTGLTNGVPVWVSVTAVSAGGAESARSLAATATPVSTWLPPTRVSGTLSASTTWSAGVVHQLAGDLVIPEGVTLSISPGAVVKAPAGSTIRVSGSLVARGSALDPVVFTSTSDDQVGGDTTADGSSSAPRAGSWGGLVAGDGDVIDLEHAVVQYAGTAVRATPGGSVSVVRSQIRSATGNAVYAYQPGAAPVVRDSLLSGINGRAVVISNGPVDVSQLGGNRGAGNRFGGLFLYNTTQTRSATWPSWGTGDLPPVIGSTDATFTVPAGVTLTLGPAAAVKVDGNGSRIVVAGTLASAATSAKPAVITSWWDDEVVGDSNGNGYADPTAAWDWWGIDSAAGSVNLSNVMVRYNLN